jgi:predicted ester cyclase
MGQGVSWTDAAAVAPSPAGRSIEDLMSPRSRRQDLTGFDPDYSDIVDYIIRCTHRIWEEKNVGLCRSHYSADCAIHTLAGPVTGVEAVVANTLATLAAFPDRSLIGEDVIWSEDQPGLFHTSHRIVSLMTHLGDDAFGPATGRRAQVTTIADCLVRENRIVEEWLVRDNAHLVRQLRRWSTRRPPTNRPQRRRRCWSGRSTRRSWGMPPPCCPCPPKASGRRVGAGSDGVAGSGR